MLRIVSLGSFLEKANNKRLFVVGAGKRCQRFFLDNSNVKCNFIIDNDKGKQNRVFEGYGKDDIFIRDWSFLKKEVKKDDVVLITPFDYGELLEEFESDTVLKNIDCYILAHMEALQWDIDRAKESLVPFEITKAYEEKIPRRIHYFWFSGDPFPEKVQKCLDSWHKYCPDYEFVKWDLNNYKTDNVFCNEALSVKNWAFASDFGRCDVLYRYGGIYLDLDVELVKPLDDFLYDEGFMCFESANGVDPGSGMGAVKGHPVFKEICEKYENQHYIIEDGSFNRLNILEQYTSVLDKYGINRTGEYQIVAGIAVYPPLVFSPYSYMTGLTSSYEKTYGIHYWVSAWISEEEREIMERRKREISSSICNIFELL